VLAPLLENTQQLQLSVAEFQTLECGIYWSRERRLLEINRLLEQMAQAI
jgi:hypothetical protein